jgi:hypothetical protein
MLRVRNIRNQYNKRFIRPLYAQTQATPYAAVLDDSLRDAVTNNYTLPAAAFKYLSGLVPLLANFVGGELDDLGDENYVGVWRGPDSVFEILAPGFDDTGLSAAWDASTTGIPVPLYAGADGRLVYIASPAGAQVVAELIERPNANRIIVDLKV